MSAPMKKHHTKKDELPIQIGSKSPRMYLVPKSVAEAITEILKDYEQEETVAWRDAFKDVFQQTSELATILRGARAKEGMTQKELAEALGVGQAYISQIEKGSRQINVAFAKKLAKVFNTDYKVFL